jgi:hypothetical protein
MPPSTAPSSTAAVGSGDVRTPERGKRRDKLPIEIDGAAARRLVGMFAWSPQDGWRFS